MHFVAKEGLSDQNRTKARSTWLRLYSGGNMTDGPQIPGPVV